MKSVDLIVIGGGLAGCALAWRAHWMGWSVVIIDRLEPHTSSRVAAGLVTPITGSRGAASWRWNDFFSNAHAFYQKIEDTTQTSFWSCVPAVRVYQTESERQLYRSRWISPTDTSSNDSIHVREIDAHALVGVHAPLGACTLEPAARLDTNAYLAASQAYFENRNAFCRANVDCDQDIVVGGPHGVRVPSLNLNGLRLALCQGFAARENHFFDSLPLHPARGDILTIECKKLNCTQVLHSNAWVVPISLDRYLVGATYDRFSLRIDESDVDTLRFKDELLKRWVSLLTPTMNHADYQSLEQRSAVRPASYDRHPLIGPHAHHPNVFCLNGMGSKGSLMAPRLAELLIDSMNGSAVDPSLHWLRRK